MGSTSKASWSVAAGVAVVEALKDQVGLCRWNYAFRSVNQYLRSKVPGPPSASASARSSRFMRMFEREARSVSADYLKKREAEKAENVMHLICWGPK